MMDTYPVAQMNLSTKITGCLTARPKPDLIWRTDTPPANFAPAIFDQLSDFFCPNLSQVYLSPLTSGRSEANVWRAMPYYGFCEGASVVLKIGPQEKIAQERGNYLHCVAPYINEASVQLQYAVKGEQGLLVYHFIGGDLSQAVSFADHFFSQDADTICQTVDKLFRSTCRLWYDNRMAGKQIENLVELYQHGLHLDWDEIWLEAAKTGVDLSAEQISFPDLPATFINPRHWLAQRQYKLYRPIFRSMTHGDFNDHNILVTEAGTSWLIDFYRTGWNHILRDVVGLENTIKLRLAQTGDLIDYGELEQLLARQSRLDQPVMVPKTHPHHKAITVINHLRTLADILTGTSAEMLEYYEALLLTTLNSLRYQSLNQQQAQQALLSAALLCACLS